MQLYPLNEVLTAPYLISEWRPDLIEDLQKELSPDVCRIIVVGQKLEPIATRVEKWYGTKYHWEKLDKAVLEVKYGPLCCRCTFLNSTSILTGMVKLWMQSKVIVS